MLNKILVIFTGGTIGCSSDGKNLNLDEGSRSLILKLYERERGSAVKFDVAAPVDMLSENVQTSDLYALCCYMRGVKPENYDGVIITHGTDTLTFTVNLFARAFCATPVPIVFVSSLYPLTDPRANGLYNFCGAVDFIEKAALRGVYCAFKNDGENCRIHLGSRLTTCDERGFYHSALGAYFAEIVDGEVVYKSSENLPSIEDIRGGIRENAGFNLDSGIVVIRMRALLDFSVYDFTTVKPKAVVVILSHSGTICTEGDELNFRSFAAYCLRLGVPVVIAPVDGGAGVYASMADIPAGVTACYDQTAEEAILKVMCALGDGLSPSAYFSENRFFEKLR